MQPRHVRAVVSRLSPTRHPTAVAAAVAILIVAGCGGGGSTTIVSPGTGDTSTPVAVPAFVKGAVGVKHYDGVTDDLATGGLGKDGLAGVV